LPAGKHKQRKKSASRRDDSDPSQSGGESSDQLFIEEQIVAPKHVKKAKSRKSEPIPRVTRVDEYEEDEGRLESQYVLSSGNLIFG